MFSKCSSLTKIIFPNFNLENLDQYGDRFYECPKELIRKIAEQGEEKL
jgi:hypothetical protein